MFDATTGQPSASVGDRDYVVLSRRLAGALTGLIITVHGRGHHRHARVLFVWGGRLR
jgi:hypothetical protein